jgi:hypothetical protein
MPWDVEMQPGPKQGNNDKTSVRVYVVRVLCGWAIGEDITFEDTPSPNRYRGELLSVLRRGYELGRRDSGNATDSANWETA